MKTEATLLSEIASASTLREQAGLVAELDALRNSKTARVQADRDWDAAGAVVEATMQPVLVYSLHTASTEWLSDAEIPTVDSNAVHAEASLWFGKTSSMVKADAEEFAEQAKGFARRLASQFGEQAPQAERAFLDYVAFLHRREAASGLDQVQQLVDGNNQSKTTPLPEDVFDTFMEPIDPMNSGVDEAQSSENAPLLQEIMGEGGGSGGADVPDHHDTAPMTTQNPMGGSGYETQRTGSLDAPSVAHGYLYNLEDFLQAEAAIRTQASREPSDDQEDHTSSGRKVAAFGQYDREPTSNDADDCPECGTPGGYGKPGAPCPDCHHSLDAMGLCPSCNEHSQRSGWEHEHLRNHGSLRREKVASIEVQAASSLPQVQQVTDVHDAPAPTPMPTEVAFPLIPYFAGEQQAQDDNDTAQPHMSVRKQADTFTAPPQNVGSDNPMLNKTHVGGEKDAPEVTNGMEKATASLSKQAAAEYRKGARFGRDWQAGQAIVRQGSAEFEAGLYAGITTNAANQQAWLEAHEKWGAQDQGISDRIAMHEAFTAALIAEAGSSEDLDTMSPGNNPQPGGMTPLNGPGSTPPMDGGMDPAAPGGASPYNGAEPFSKPVAPDPGWVNPASGSMGSDEQKMAAFRQTIAANLTAQAAAEPKNTPVCRGCGEAFESRAVAEKAHGKKGCGTEDGERGYEMKRESEAW